MLRTLKSPTGATLSGSVDQPDADRVGPDHAGVDGRRMDRRRHRVQPGTMPLVGSPSGSTPGVFSISLRPMMSASSPASACEQLVALAGELGGLAGVGAAAVEVLRCRRTCAGPLSLGGRVEGQEEVERVHCGRAQRAADRLGRGGPRVDRRVVGRRRREDPVQAEVEPEDAGRVGDGVAAAEADSSARTDRRSGGGGPSGSEPARRRRG